MAKKILNGLDLSNQRIINVGDPSAGTDAVNLQTAQNLARGLASTKMAVRVASTTNIVIAAPGATIDGFALTAGERVLLKDQTTSSQNGPYLWNGAAVAMTRTLDADVDAELQPGTNVFVVSGTVNADRQYLITSDTVIVVGTTAMVWTQFGGGNTYTGSNGILLTGNNFTGVVAAGGGLVVGGSGFSVDTAIVARKASGLLGNNSLTAIAVTHNLATKDATATLRAVSNDEIVDTDVVNTDANTTTFTFGAAPSTGQYRWTIIA